METDRLRFQTEGLRQRNNPHSIVLIALIALNCVTFAVMLFFNLAASQDFGIFKNNTGDISNANEVNLTPAGWTFSTWGVIYIWQAAWLVFNVVLIFKRYETSRLYREPPVLTPMFHIFVFLNFCFNAGWLALWDQQSFTWSFVLIFLMLLALYVAIVISHKNSYDAEVLLERKKSIKWLYRLLVNNGLAFYATWLTIATHLNLAIAITYEWAAQENIDEYEGTSAIIVLSLLTVVLVIYFIMDIYFFEKYLRYTFSTYVQLLFAFAGVLSKNWFRKDASAIFELILTIIVGLMFLTKIVSTVYRAKKDY